MTINIGFLLIEDFSSFAVTCMTNAFRAANRLTDQKTYRWDFLSHDDGIVVASDGFQVQSTLSIHDTLEFDYLFVAAGLDTDPPYRPRLNAALQRLSRRTKVIGSMSAGAFILARAGLLDGYSFTLHWENQPAFAEEFPLLPYSSNIYVMDRNRWTCAGGLSAIDLAMQIIEAHDTRALAHEVANQFQVDRVREGHNNQRPYSLENFSTLPARLQSAIQIMNDNIEAPLSVPDVAGTTGTTVRSLERLFKKHLDTAPATFYRRIRLERARHLLWHTNLSVLDISCMTGFSSPSYLSRMYQNQYDKMPSQERD